MNFDTDNMSDLSASTPITRSSQRTKKVERAPLTDLPVSISPTSPVTRQNHSELRKRQREEERYFHGVSPPESLRLRPDMISTQQTPGVFKFRRRISSEPVTDFFHPVPIEVVRLILMNLSKRDMYSAMRTCRKFYNAGITCDNWQFIDMHNKFVSDTALLDIVERKVQILRLSDTHVNGPRLSPLVPFSPSATYHLTHLDMGRATFVRIDCLCAILKGSVHLKALCMEGIDMQERGEEIGSYIGANRSLRFLDLSLTNGINESAVNSIIHGCRNVEELNLGWCGLDSACVKALVASLPFTLLRINLSGTLNKEAITDTDVLNLVSSCPNLIEVDFSDNLSLACPSVDHIMKLEMIDRISLNRCYTINPTTFLNFEGVSVLNVHGTMTDEGERRLKLELPDVKVNTEILNYVAKPTVPPAVSSIWRQRTRDIY